MTMNVIDTATHDVGGGVVVSFGSGDSGGRLQASAAGRGGRQSSGGGQVRSVRNQINRSDAPAAAKRRALEEIDMNTSGNGNIPRGILRDILEEFNERYG